MDRQLIWVWGTFVGLSAGTLFLTTSVTIAVAVGISAAACVWLAVSKTAQVWQQRVEAFVAASRGEQVRLEPSEADEVPLKFAREVQQATELMRAIDEACQHGRRSSLTLRGVRVQVAPLENGSSAVVSLA